MKDSNCIVIFIGCIYIYMYMYIYILLTIVISLYKNYIWVEKFYINFMILAEQFSRHSDLVAPSNRAEAESSQVVYNDV